MAYISGKKEASHKIPVRCKIWSFGLLIWFLMCKSVGLIRSELWIFLSFVQ